MEARARLSDFYAFIPNPGAPRIIYSYTKRASWLIPHRHETGTGKKNVTEVRGGEAKISESAKQTQAYSFQKEWKTDSGKGRIAEHDEGERNGFAKQS